MAIPEIGQEFQITKAVITAERLGNEYDVKQMISEINYFEDLSKPYVTAQVVILDDAGVFDTIKIKGTETLEIRIEGVEGEFEGIGFTYKWNILNVVQIKKTGDRSEMHHIHCISPHAYKDQLIKISRSYTGKIEDIAEAVLKNHLDVRTDRNYMGGLSTRQEPIRIITPYISPLETVEWLMDRATSDIGAPFYAYCTLYDQEQNGGEDVIRFGNLEYMFSRPVWNQDLPLLYSQARGQDVAGSDLAAQAVLVKNLTLENIQDNFKMISEGAVGSLLSTYDTYSSQTYERHFKVRDLLDKMEFMLQGGAQNVFDDQQEFTIENETKKTDEFDARIINTVSSFGTYGAYNSYHDVFDQSEALNKIRHYAIKSMLNKNMIDLVLPGISFFAQLANGTSGVTVGDLVKINFKNTNVEDAGDEEFNKELSGTFLIHKCRNIFRNTVHEVVVSVSKIADLDGAAAAGDVL